LFSELTSFIEYIGGFFSDYCSDEEEDDSVQLEVKKDFIGKNLIEMTELFDFADEVCGCKKLLTLSA
jgi:hypothetical protein